MLPVRIARLAVTGLAMSCSKTAQGREGSAFGRQMLEHQTEMVEHAAFGMIIRRLLASDRGGDFRQHLFKQAAFAQQFQPARRRGVEKTT